MTMRDCSRYIAKMKTVSDMRLWMEHIRNIAAACGQFTTRDVYDAALYYMASGRLSGSCERRILKNIRVVIKNLNQRKCCDYESIGSYLKSYSE